jgi:hypothetical protein
MKSALVAVIVLKATLALAADGPALDAAKYPQDTPQNAANSIIKAIDANDLEYWVAHLVTPADTKRRVEKNGSIAQAAKNYAEKQSKQLKAMRDVIEKMLKESKPTEGEENGVKWVRFQLEEKLLQFEKQSDGRWCMNTRVNAVKKDAPKPEEKK